MRFCVVRIVHLNHGDLVERMEDGFAEVHVVDGELPVFRLVLLVEVGVEVEHVVVSVEARAAGADHVVFFRIVEPLVKLLGGNIAGVHFAAQIHFGFNGTGFRVVDLGDLGDVHVRHIPVGGVQLRFDDLLRDIVAHDELAAVKHGFMVGGEHVAALRDELCVRREEVLVSKGREEVGDGRLEGVLKGVIIQRFHAHGGKIAFFTGNALAVVFFRTRNGEHHVRKAGSVRGIQDVLRGGDPVLRGNFRVFLLIIGHPLDAFADLEGPDEAVFGTGPAFRKAGLAEAKVIVLNERVDVHCRGVGGSDQIVPVGYVIAEQIGKLRFVAHVGLRRDGRRRVGVCGRIRVCGRIGLRRSIGALAACYERKHHCDANEHSEKFCSLHVFPPV